MDMSFLAGKRILVGDDDMEVSALLLNILEMAGAKATVAHSGGEVLRLAAESPPDLVFLDVMMPGIDGCGVLLSLRGEAATARVPVIMVTGRVEPSLTEILKGLGAFAVLNKPFRLDECVDSARRALGGGAA
ncbi:MAG: response regulator [Planctomycetes bacterium]|nr:response regulator [Planctomycetota bacterium]